VTDPSAAEADRGASSAAEVDAARHREKHRDAFRDRDDRRRAERARERVDSGVEPLAEYCAAAIAR